MKLILAPKLILSPLGSVNRWLSSSTELSDSIHSGSMSPSHTIQHSVSTGSLTTARALAVSTPSLNSRVSWFISPSSWFLGMDLGFMMCVTMFWFIFS